jgi:tetratricopeptide (TPR) repeat protein
LAQPVEVAKMTPEEGAQLLLRRAGRLAADAPLERAEVEDREPALALSRTLDGLPLALDQAGAYIVEGPVSLAEYLELYKAEGAKLRAHRGALGDHDPVSATFALALEKLEAASPATADLLRLGALLAPEPIPEEIFLEGAPELGDQLSPACSSRYAFTAMISAAHRLSLLQRDPQSRTLSIHRLVQDVMRDTMDGEARRLWAERAPRAVDRAFPGVEYSAWPACERLLPHAMPCFSEIVQWEIDDPDVARLLKRTASYLTERARYSEAEPLYRRALAIREKALGPDHPNTAESLNNLAGLYRSQGRYAEAEPLYRRALAICEQALGPDHPNVGVVRGNLAALLDEMGRQGEAEA